MELIGSIDKSIDSIDCIYNHFINYIKMNFETNGLSYLISAAISVCNKMHFNVWVNMEGFYRSSHV